MRTARTSKNTYQYTCPEPGCELKYAVGDLIVTGTLTPELLKSRGGRRTGFCHCGHKFSIEYRDTKNVMWRIPMGKDDEAIPFFPQRTLSRVPSGNSSTDSPQMMERRERMDDDPLFADSILSIAEHAARAMASSTLESKREEGRKRLKSILKARKALETRLASHVEASSEEPSDDEPTHYSPALEAPVLDADREVLMMEASS